ncbi:hypothetical protein Patl1_09165 [Pistacia atlantica]|uniref:Uncharacterized protein n=1 Tax=Pistacia atlantica TaxID=434234 RepID=A0ACC1AJ72_9ROSI|nr:hypothetical protein Patl1_09165 [Pistacia atlantica]
MTDRAYVLIFFFWAVLTIITPTLILLSESSKPNFDPNGKESEGINARKMMTYLEKHPKTPVTLRPLLNESHIAPAPAPGTGTGSGSGTQTSFEN